MGYVMQNKPDSDRQVSCIFSHIQNLDIYMKYLYTYIHTQYK